MKNSKIENLLYAEIENEKLKYLLGGTDNYNDNDNDIEDDGDDIVVGEE